MQCAPMRPATIFALPQVQERMLWCFLITTQKQQRGAAGTVHMHRSHDERGESTVVRHAGSRTPFRQGTQRRRWRRWLRGCRPWLPPICRPPLGWVSYLMGNLCSKS